MKPAPLAQPSELFAKLEKFLQSFEPLEFLCQASLTYLFTPENTFHSESDDVQIWGRRIEFAAGFYAARGSEGTSPVNGTHLEDFKSLIDAYYNALDLERLLASQEGERVAFTVASARIHSMHVRGEAYPHQFEEYAKELYGEHDEWFRRHLGFTIHEAYTLWNAMAEELNVRHSRYRNEAATASETLVRNDTTWKDAGLTKKQALSSAQVRLFFGEAKQIYRFTKDDILRCSGLPESTVEALTQRLAQRPPFQNTLYPNTFTNAEAAPWDYNTLSERPLITDGESLWLVIPYLMRQTLYYTFFFDLMADRSYKVQFEKSRGGYLEKKVASYLQRIFPKSSILLNPEYPDGNEFCDVLVLYDGKIIVVQCKSKALTRGARIGVDADSIKADVQRAIKDAIEQGARCRKYLERDSSASLVHEGTAFSIDMTLVSTVDIMAVTFMPLHMMATRIREVEEDLNLPHAEFPAWAISLGDLDIVTEICHSPARLFQYIGRRMLLESGSIRVHGDEMDLLGFFLDQGLWMQDERFAEANLLAIAGYSGGIDEYVFRRWDCGNNVSPPEVARPDGFYRLVDAIEQLSQFHRTDCAISILELSGTFSKEFVRVVTTTKKKTSSDGQTHSLSIQGEEGTIGISFQAFPANSKPDFVDLRTEGFGLIKKYAEKAEKWVALGWILGSNKEVDRAFWLAYPWEYEAKLEPIVVGLRKRQVGERVDLSS